MARKKNRRKAAAQAADQVQHDRARTRQLWVNRAVLAGLPLILLAGAWLAWTAHDQRTSFNALIEQGQSALTDVTRESSKGRTHVANGTPVAADEDFPLSGTHWPSWVDPGFYTEPREKGQLIHSLEHGMIVIYYGQLDDEAESRLHAWTNRFNGDWSGLVVVPHPRLRNRQELVVTAWQHRLDLNEFDPAAIAAFMDEFRGKGPENPVR